MNNLTAYFKNMTLKEAYDAKFETLLKAGMPADLLKDLNDICNMSLGVKGAYQFLHIEDKLFTDIYGGGEIGSDGVKRFVYPFVADKKIPDDIREAYGPIGTQTSKWHYETLQQHVALVAANAVDAGIEPKLAVALAVLHDIGKKYTSATNKVGGVCFYNHAQVSAFIATHWLSNWTYPMDWDEMGDEIIVVIYAHMYPHTTWKGTKHWKTGAPVDYRGDFYKELLAFCDGDKERANHFMATVDTFEKCDVGVEAIDGFTPEIEQKIKRGEDLILNTKVAS